MSMSEDTGHFIPSEKLVELMLKNSAEFPLDKDGITAVQTYMRQCMLRRFGTIAFRAITKWRQSKVGHISGIKIHSIHGGIFVLEELKDGRVIIRISKDKKFTDDTGIELINKLELNRLELKGSEINEIMALLHNEIANFINNDGCMSGRWGELKIDSTGMYIELLKYRPRGRIKIRIKIRSYRET